MIPSRLFMCILLYPVCCTQQIWYFKIYKALEKYAKNKKLHKSFHFRLCTIYVHYLCALSMRTINNDAKLKWIHSAMTH